MMQEDYFLYFEELDWATRGSGRFRLGYAPKSIVYHKEGASIGTDASGGSALSIYYLFRNRIRFTHRFAPAHLMTVLFASWWDILKLVGRGRVTLALAAFRGVMMLSRARPS
jgi:GT2 family glycosyltransferase